MFSYSLLNLKISPFPSKDPSRNTKDFYWNEWLSRSFSTINLGFCSVVLIQGVAEQKEIVLPRFIESYFFSILLSLIK